MKKPVKVGLGLLGLATAGFAGIGSLLATQAVNRDAKVIKKVFAMFSDDDMSEFSGGKMKENEAWVLEHGAQEFTMESFDAKKMKSIFIPAEKETDVYAFCVHGYRGSIYGDYGLQSRFYHEQGFNVILIEQRATQNSEGDYIGFGYYEYQDCMKWLDYYMDKFGHDIRFFVCGISMGGATVCMMSGEESLPDNVKFIVSDCAYTSANAEMSYCFPHYTHLPAEPWLSFVNAVNRRHAGYSFDMANPILAVQHAKVPMLFIHGGADDFVPTSMVHELYDACTAPKDLLIIDGAIHACSYFTDPESYQNKVLEFVDKYIKNR